MFEDIKSSLRQLDLEDQRPWLVGFSGDAYSERTPCGRNGRSLASKDQKGCILSNGHNFDSPFGPIRYITSAERLAAEQHKR